MAGVWQSRARVGARWIFSGVCLILVGAAAASDTRLPAPESDAPAERIVSLAPFLTEIAFAAGAGERLVGVVGYSDYPPPAQRLARVGDHTKVDMEGIVALQPDLVLAWESGNRPRQIEALKRLGIPVFVAEPRSLEDIPALIETVGRLAGTQQPARASARAFREKHQALRTRYAAREPVDVFYQIWHRPLMTVNGEHVISAVIRLCGGRNVFADLPQLAGKVGMESVLAANPDVIIASGMNDTPGAWQRHWRQWPQLRAVRNAQLHYIDPDLIQRHTPRILAGAQLMCGHLEAARQAAAEASGTD